jgi:hypothetical protein
MVTKSLNSSSFVDSTNIRAQMPVILPCNVADRAESLSVFLSQSMCNL